MRVSIGYKIEINQRSKNKPLFADLIEKIKNVTIPTWLQFDGKTAEVVGHPVLTKSENMFDLNTVIEFYSR